MYNLRWGGCASQNLCTCCPINAEPPQFSVCRHLRHTKTMQHAANFRHGMSWLMSTFSFQGLQLMRLPDANHHQAFAKTPNHITCFLRWCHVYLHGVSVALCVMCVTTAPAHNVIVVVCVHDVFVQSSACLQHCSYKVGAWRLQCVSLKLQTC